MLIEVPYASFMQDSTPIFLKQVKLFTALLNMACVLPVQYLQFVFYSKYYFLQHIVFITLVVKIQSLIYTG